MNPSQHMEKLTTFGLAICMGPKWLATSDRRRSISRIREISWFVKSVGIQVTAIGRECGAMADEFYYRDTMKCILRRRCNNICVKRKLSQT